MPKNIVTCVQAEGRINTNIPYSILCISLVISLISGCTDNIAFAQSTSNRFINPAGLAAPSGYTHAVEAGPGRTLYLSGQIAIDQKGQLVGDKDFKAQAEQVFSNLKIALEASGATFDNVVKLNIYVTDISQLNVLRMVRDKYINLKHAPASTLVEVSKFVRNDLLLEIDAIVVMNN